MDERTTIKDIFTDLSADIDIASQGQNALSPSEFLIDEFSKYLMDEGYINDLPAITRYEEGNLIAVNGYYYDDGKDELHLFIADVNNEKDIIPLSNKKIDSQFNKIERFYNKSKDREFVIGLTPTSPGREVADIIFQKFKIIKSVQFHFMTIAAVGDRLKINRPSKQIEGEKVIFNYRLWDLTWYYNILESQRGAEDLILHIPEGIECLIASEKGSEVPTYLASIKGQTLADWFSKYGDRLVESNVRTYLQARGKVNKAIIRTIKEKPERFLSYNNGVTASCSKLKIKKLKRGGNVIEKIDNLQIVNGGQTSGALLQAQTEGADLSKVWIQMKISKVDEGVRDSEDLIQNISRFSNFQNAVNDADFFSNSPFNKKIQQLSGQIRVTDSSEGKANTFWFYERVRGQYNNQPKIGATRSEKNRFKKAHPPSQKFNKTDLAKYYNTFEALPHFVSQGAAKNLLRFATTIKNIIGEEGTELDKINDQFYKDLVAKAIIYKTTDKAFLSNKHTVLKGSFKSQTVNYSLAWLVKFLEGKNLILDFSRIWREQTPNEKFLNNVMIIGEFMNNQIVNKQPGRDTLGIPSEYTKTKIALDNLLVLKIKDVKLDDFSDYVIEADDNTNSDNEGIREEKENMDLVILEIGIDGWKSIHEVALKKKNISSSQNRALERFIKFGIWDSEADKIALLSLYENMENLKILPNEYKKIKVMEKYHAKQIVNKGNVN